MLFEDSILRLRTSLHPTDPGQCPLFGDEEDDAERCISHKGMVKLVSKAKAENTGLWTLNPGLIQFDSMNRTPNSLHVGWYPTSQPQIVSSQPKKQKSRIHRFYKGSQIKCPPPKAKRLYISILIPWGEYEDETLLFPALNEEGKSLSLHAQEIICKWWRQILECFRISLPVEN